MEQINVGDVGEEGRVSTKDVCLLCDAQTTVIIRPNDICSCCDSVDWFNKDE